MKKIHWLALSVLFLVAPSVWAVSHYEGYIERVNDQVYLLKPGAKFRLQPGNGLANEDLQRLNTGDYLKFVGTRHLRPPRLRVDSINAVGLKDLLGVWETADKVVFEFVDFTSLRLTWPSQGIQALDFHYSMAPDKDNKWTIFIVDESSINLGKMQIIDNQAQLQVINPSTGDQEDFFDLRRVR